MAVSLLVIPIAVTIKKLTIKINSNLEPDGEDKDCLLEVGAVSIDGLIASRAAMIS